MTWTFLYLMVFLKLPIFALLYLVWWAVRQTPEQSDGEDGEDDGGSRVPRHPRPPLRPLPRRGPHRGARPPAAPARVRAVGRDAHRTAR